jgi:hypothetical protein
LCLNCSKIQGRKKKGKDSHLLAHSWCKEELLWRPLRGTQKLKAGTRFVDQQLIAKKIADLLPILLNDIT